MPFKKCFCSGRQTRQGREVDEETEGVLSRLRVFEILDTMRF